MFSIRLYFCLSNLLSSILVESFKAAYNLCSLKALLSLPESCIHCSQEQLLARHIIFRFLRLQIIAAVRSFGFHLCLDPLDHSVFANDDFRHLSNGHRGHVAATLILTDSAEVYPLRLSRFLWAVCWFIARHVRENIRMTSCLLHAR